MTARLLRARERNWVEAQLGCRVLLERTHNWSGRNRLIVCATSDGHEYLFKQSAPNEVLAIELSRVVSREPVGLKASEGWVLYQLDPRSTTLDRVDVREWPTLLSDLATKLAVLHRVDYLRLPEVRPPWPIFESIEWPDFLSFTEPAREVVRLIQQRPLLVSVADALHHVGVGVLSHGDIKPDNVLITDGIPELIDWELAGIGARHFDIGATVGMLLSESITRGITTRGIAIASSDRLTEDVATILAGYDGDSGSLNLNDAVRAAAGWLVGRAWTGAMHDRVVAPSRLVELTVAHRLVRAL